VNGAGLEIVVIMGGIEMAVGPGTGKGVRAETVAMIDEDTRLKATSSATAHVRDLPAEMAPGLPDLEHHLGEEDTRVIGVLSAETIGPEMTGEAPMVHQVLVI
jgi:hypothetical protein